MDPNAALEEMLYLARYVVRAADTTGQDPDPAAAVRLAELVLALDEYLARYGVMPGRWA